MRGYQGTSGPVPVCSFVNVKLNGIKPGAGVAGTVGTVLLENPKGDYHISYDELVNQVCCRSIYLLNTLHYLYFVFNN